MRLTATLPEPGVVSAKAVGELLYVSALSGISIYDIGDPRRPERIGRLELPHVQNEDVDVGNGILLVTDDPLAGRGILHVVDVRDPRNPRVISRYGTWVPGLLTGSPTFGRRGGVGHTASCIDDCRYAWLAGSPDGIEIVDLRDPAHPRFAGKFRARAATGGFTHDVQVDPRGIAWVAGAAGTAAYSTRNPRRPRLVTATDRRGGRSPLNDFVHHNSLRVSDSTLLVTEEDLQTGCRRAGSFQTWGIRGRRTRPLDSFSVERDDRARILCSAHYFDHRDGLVAAGFYEQGLRLLDVRNPRRIRQVGFRISDRAMTWGALFAPTDPTSSVVYVLDHARGIDVVELDRDALAPVRRPRVRKRGAVGGLDVGAYADDGLDVARQGARLDVSVEVGVFSGRRARNVAVSVRLPRQVRVTRLPRGARLDRPTRTVSFTLARLRERATRKIRTRVARGARRGSVLETIAYARAPGDLVPVTDRWVDRGKVGRRNRRSGGLAGAASAAGGRALAPMLCGIRLPPRGR